MNNNIQTDMSVKNMKISQYCVNWDSFTKKLSNGFTSLQQNEEFVDMTLAADGHLVKVHKSVLALASPYIKSMLQSTPHQHPIVFLDNVGHDVLNYILTYVYTGEVSVEVDKMESFMRVAKGLRLSGLFSLPVPKGRDKTEVFDTNVTQEGVKNNVVSKDGNFMVNRAPDTIPGAGPASTNFEENNVEILAGDIDTSISNVNNVEIVQNTMILRDSGRQMIPNTDEGMLNDRYSDINVTADGYQYKLEISQGHNKADYTTNIVQDTFNNPDLQISTDTNQTININDVNLDSVDKNDVSATKIHTSISSIGHLDIQAITPQYTVSNRGCLQLILNRYMYNCHHESHGGRKRRWRCIDYKSKHCPAFIDSNCDILTARKFGHCHSFHDEKIRKKVKSKLVVSNLNVLKNRISDQKKEVIS